MAIKDQYNQITVIFFSNAAIWLQTYAVREEKALKHSKHTHSSFGASLDPKTPVSLWPHKGDM